MSQACRSDSSLSDARAYNKDKRPHKSHVPAISPRITMAHRLMLIQDTVCRHVQEIVEEVRGKKLFFTTDVEAAVREAEIIFVSVNTPTKDYGFGKGLAADLTYWEGAARAISRACESGVGLLNGTTKIIVEKSTVPVHTADAMSCVLKANCPPGVSFEVRADVD